MSSGVTRRKFFSKSGQALAVMGAGAYAGFPAVARAGKREVVAKGVNYYEKLGVSPFINAAGTYTVLSASTMPEEVQAAIEHRLEVSCPSRGACCAPRASTWPSACSARPPW